MRKLIHQTQSEIFERVVRDRSGRAFRVRFVIVERGGALRGRIISCAPVVAFLPSVKKSVFATLINFRARSTVSPYFNKFAFLTAIKIRAPSFK